MLGAPVGIWDSLPDVTSPLKGDRAAFLYDLHQMPCAVSASERSRINFQA